MEPKTETSVLTGKKVKLVGDHPHAGETGVIEGIERTAAGPGLRIKLDDCPDMTEGCFVFSPSHIQYLKR